MKTRKVSQIILWTATTKLLYRRISSRDDDFSDCNDIIGSIGFSISAASIVS